jgi:uncharacterized protein YbjT (DUF2867 family)
MTRVAVVGVSGKTGGATARSLLEMGVPLRAIVRDPAKGEPWAARGAEVAVADLADPAALSEAFEGAAAAFVLNPPAYTLPDLFTRAEELAGSIAEAARRSRLPRLVVLSSIGAHLRSGTGNIRTNTIFEDTLRSLPAPVTFLRPAYFIENWAWVAGAAAGQGILPSFLAPPDRGIPMVSTKDVGDVAARAMLGLSAATGVIELEGPAGCSPRQAADAFARALGRSVDVAIVPEEDWPGALVASGFTPRTIAAWIELFRSFNAGAIAFEEGMPRWRGRVAIEEAIGAIVRGT